jgi:hypothetical protein
LRSVPSGDAKYTADVLYLQAVWLSIMTETIQDRIQAGNKAYYANQMMLKNRYINRGAKMQIYKTRIRPIVTHGCQSWTMKKRMKIFYEDLRRKLLEEFTAQ